MPPPPPSDPAPLHITHAVDFTKANKEAVKAEKRRRSTQPNIKSWGDWCEGDDAFPAICCGGCCAVWGVVALVFLMQFATTRDYYNEQETSCPVVGYEVSYRDGGHTSWECTDDSTSDDVPDLFFKVEFLVDVDTLDPQWAVHDVCFDARDIAEEEGKLLDGTDPRCWIVEDKESGRLEYWIKDSTYHPVSGGILFWLFLSILCCCLCGPFWAWIAVSEGGGGGSTHYHHYGGHRRTGGLGTRRRAGMGSLF